MPDALKKILREDPKLPPWLQFEELRRLGIEYIAKFSGDVWTDHNLHDPGITILEVLCYALSDLGYRTQLDIEELLAPPAPLDRDDNFHTPAQILSCNPLTILDYRKMLVDIRGVRNAWLMPAEAQEVPLFVDCETGALGFTRLTQAPNCDEVNLPASAQELKLNGLYKVLLDLDPVLTEAGEEGCKNSGDATGSILQEVKRRLLRHRNLSEDFLDIIVLEDEQIGVCADIELKPAANPDEVLLKIYEAVELFLSPRVPFYSLPQMLRRGKTMEEIFAGRPYTLDSHGFLDAEELAGLELPRVLRASDFYQVIMEVEGVRAIKGLYLASFVEGVQRTVEQAWTLVLMPNHRPVFAPAISQFKFHKGALRLAADAAAVTDRFKKRLLDFQKNKLSPELLDEAVPYGRHRADLADYWSIQHEFPLTYRIGEGQMPDSAGEERKVQALQLKGYLAFYDQLLADYLSQLGHVRQLLSWDDQRQTYFPQPVETMPERERIFRFGADGGAARQGEALAQATRTYPHPTARDMAIEQLMAAFENYGEALVSVAADEEGRYRFYAYSAPGGEAVLVSAQRYESEAAARLDAQTLAFLGILPQSYEKQNRAAVREYAFRFVYAPVSYQQFLQRIAEPQPLDYGRRDAFLNHLLARFGEQFTEYVLLMYALNQGEADDEKIIRDKARFLQSYGDIGRNRGRAFDYSDAAELWDSDQNISGLERRVGALMGLDNWQRRNLNAFSVTIREEACRLRILDHRGQVLLETVATFATDEEREALEEQLRQAWGEERYETVDCALESAHSFRLLDKKGKALAIHPRTYGTAALRDEMLACTKMYFGEPLNLLVRPIRENAGWRFRLELDTLLPGSHESREYFRSDEVYDSAAEAEQAGKRLTQAIRVGETKLLKIPNGQKIGFGITLQGNKPGLPVARWHKIYETRELRNERHAVLDRYLGALAPAAGRHSRSDCTQGGRLLFLAARP
jgi:hypothetical protein